MATHPMECHRVQTAVTVTAHSIFTARLKDLGLKSGKLRLTIQIEPNLCRIRSLLSDES